MKKLLLIIISLINSAAAMEYKIAPRISVEEHRKKMEIENEQYNKMRADVKAQDPHGNTNLHHTLRYPYENKKELVSALLEKGADINRENNNGDTPLITAIEGESSVDVIEFLIKEGAEIDAFNIHYQTSLHKAIWNTQPQTVRCLLDNGARVTITDFEDDIPLIPPLELGLDKYEELFGLPGQIKEDDPERRPIEDSVALAKKITSGEDESEEEFSSLKDAKLAMHSASEKKRLKKIITMLIAATEKRLHKE